jgi:hypothetical protein
MAMWAAGPPKAVKPRRKKSQRTSTSGEWEGFGWFAVTAVSVVGVSIVFLHFYAFLCEKERKDIFMAPVHRYHNRFLGLSTDIINSSWIAGPIFFIVSIVALIICATTYNHIAEIYTRVYPQRKTP